MPNTFSSSAVPAAAPWVYLIDDDALLRRALVRLLVSAGYRVSAFPSAEEFLLAARLEDEPACLVVDLRMPGLSGLELQELLLEWGYDLPLVFISGRADVSSGVRAMKGGAIDFLQKPLSEQALLAAVGRALERARQRQAERSDRAMLQARLATLTPREKEVFGLIASGRMNKQVGAELGTTEKTIKVHRGRVMQKMAAGSLPELVRMADKLASAPVPTTEQGDTLVQAGRGGSSIGTGSTRQTSRQ